MKTTEKKLLSNEEIASFCSQAAMLCQAGIPPGEGMDLRGDPYRMPTGRKLSQSTGSHQGLPRLLPAYDRSG